MKKIGLAASMILIAFVLSFFEFNSIYFLAVIPFFVATISYKNYYCWYLFFGMLVASFFIDFKTMPLVLIATISFVYFSIFILNKFKINYKYFLSIIGSIFAEILAVFYFVVNKEKLEPSTLLLLAILGAFLTYNYISIYYDLKFKEDFSINKKQLCFIAFFLNLLTYEISLFNASLKFNFILSSILNYLFIMLDPLVGFVGIFSNVFLNLYLNNTLLLFSFVPLVFSLKIFKKRPIIKGLIYLLFSILLSVYLEDFTCYLEIILVSISIALLSNKNFIYLQKYIIEPHDYELKLYQKSYYKCLNKNKKIYKVINLLEKRIQEKERANKNHKEIMHNAMQFLTDKLKEEEDIKVKENIIKQLSYINVEILGLKIFSDYFYNYKIVLEIKGSKSNIDKCLSTIEEYLGVNLYSDCTYYNSVLKSYTFILKNDEKVKFNLAIKQRCKEPGVCGDSYLVFNIKNKKYLLISDGMGHGKNANHESSQALILLKEFIELGMDAKDAIIVCNTLIYNREKETFNTLDLFEYDMSKDEMCLYKNGSGSTYIRHNKRVERVNSKNLPLGIVEEINVEKKVLNKDLDYIVLTSDGIKKDLTKVISNAKKRNSKLLSDEILKSEGNDIDDDQTIVVISVIKKDGVC